MMNRSNTSSHKVLRSCLPTPKVLTLGITPGGLNNLSSYLLNNTLAWVAVVRRTTRVSITRNCPSYTTNPASHERRART